MVHKRRPSFLNALILYHAINDGILASLSAMFPILARIETFNLTYENIGILTSLGLLVTVILQVLTGKAGDVRNPQYLMIGGILLMALATLLLTQAYDYITLLLVVLVIRIGASFYHPIGIGWISKRFKGEALDRSMGYQSAFGDAGVLISFMTTGFIAINFGWRAPFVIWGISNIAAVVIGSVIKYDIKVPKIAKGDPDGRDISFSKLFKGFKFSLIPLAITGAAYTITTNFGPLLVTDKLHMGADIAGLVVSLWIGSGVISATFYGRISHSIGRRRSLILSFIVVALTSLVIGYSDDIYIVSIMMVPFGFFLFISWPGLFAMISDATGKVSQGFTFGIIFSGQIIGGAVIAYICGIVAGIFGIGTTFMILSAIAVLPIITLLGLRK